MSIPLAGNVTWLEIPATIAMAAPTVSDSTHQSRSLLPRAERMANPLRSAQITLWANECSDCRSPGPTVRLRRLSRQSLLLSGFSRAGYWCVPPSRASSLATVVARHLAPRIVGTCRRFNSSAMALSLVKPAARSSLMTAAKAMARASAARLVAAPPLCARPACPIEVARPLSAHTQR